MEKKDDKIQIAVNTMNWGPCVVKLKILDNFKKVLLDEAKKTELDFQHRLAGQIAKERGYSDKQRDIIIPILHHILVCMTNAFNVIKIKNTNINQNTL